MHVERTIFHLNFYCHLFIQIPLGFGSFESRGLDLMVMKRCCPREAFQALNFTELGLGNFDPWNC